MIRKMLPLVVLAVLAAATASRANQKSLTLDVLYHPEKKVDFDGSPPRIVGWLKDGRHYIESKGDVREGRQLVKVDARSGQSQPLYDRDRLTAAFERLGGLTPEEAGKLAKEGEITSSPDEKSLLIEYGNDLFHYDFESDLAKRLTTSPQVKEEEATFSPDGRRVAFVRRRDLFTLSVDSGREKRLTRGGGENTYNGILDWVYQEEIYGRGRFKGYWWSPDSQKIAYLKLQETRVPSFTVIDHLPTHLTTEVTRYPKAGDPNPVAALAVIGAGGGKNRNVDLGKYDLDDLLIVRVDWTPDSRQVVFQAQNREQTWLDLNMASPANGKTKTLFRETSPAWVNRLDDPLWLPDGSFLWRSERDGWSHLYHYSADGQLRNRLTSGEWEVRRVHGHDPETGFVYLSGTHHSPISWDVYRVGLDGSGLQRLSRREGSHVARFNDQLTLYVDSWSNFTTPIQTRLHDSQGAEVRVIDANPAEKLAEYNLSTPEHHQVPTRDGFLMEAILIKPPDFDPSKKYPVMSYAYSGPHAPVVRNAWGGTTYLWHQMLAQKGYLIWMCDNRTASGKGARSAWPLHRNFGELELRDLEDGLDWLTGNAWVDSSRIGLWGWSFGGYMTGYALTHSKRFKLGIVGAPVTDWSLYDSVYTERYMGTPQNNPEGYSKSSVLEAAENLHGKMLLLHGTIDDNVHLQNSVRLAYELQKAGKDFEVMFYPKSRHGVRDPAQLYHLRKLMTRFIEENL